MNSVTNDSLVESKISLKKAVYLSFIVVVAGFFFVCVCVCLFVVVFFGGGGGGRGYRTFFAINKKIWPFFF